MNKSIAKDNDRISGFVDGIDVAGIKNQRILAQVYNPCDILCFGRIYGNNRIKVEVQIIGCDRPGRIKRTFCTRIILVSVSIAGVKSKRLG